MENEENNSSYTKRPFQNIYGDNDIDSSARIGAYVEIGPSVKIGKNCLIEAFCFIPEGVTIGDNVFLGPRVTFTNDKYPPSHGVHWMETIIEDNVRIGAGSVILPGVRLSKGIIIGAGAVVTKSIEAPPNTIAFGNPAKIKK